MKHCSKCGGISTLAIVLCSIAVLLVVAFVVIKIAQNCKPKYRIVNQDKNQNTQTKKDVSLNDIAIDLVQKWDAIHNSKKAEDFATIYAPQVKYYQQIYTPDKVVKSKRDLFAKTPDFMQMISNFDVANNADGSVKVHFDKLVQTSTVKPFKTYPSYLVVKQINGDWRIVEESDDVTDANLAKKINAKTSEQTSKNTKACFVSGLSRCKCFDNNGGEYNYEDGRRIKVHLFYNQNDMDCIIIDESGNREALPLLFGEIGWDEEENRESEYIYMPSKGTEYVIGQHDFDSDGIDELVIAMRCPEEDLIFGLAMIVYRVYDKSLWHFECPYVYCDIRASIVNNKIKVPKNHRSFCYEYAFENGTFVDYTNF